MNQPPTAIACPTCGTRCMVPAGIFQFNCPGCQTLCRLARPSPAPDSAATAPDDEAAAEEPKSKKPVDPIVAAAVAGGVLVLLLMIFAVAAMGVMSLSQPEVAEVAPVAPPPAPIVYREVDLPEATRQQIYRDIRVAEKTSVGAKVPLPKDSDIGRFWQQNMQKVMNREFTLHTLLNDISEADIKEIIKEGNAKDW